MHFCVKCDNMYYIRVTEDDANKLIYYCRNCGHEDTLLTSENVCVTRTQLTQSEKTYSHIVNKYTKLDPTLPRINSIKCPNQNCASNNNFEILNSHFQSFFFISVCSSYISTKALSLGA